MTKPRKLKAKSGSQSDRIETRDFRVAIAQFAPVYLDKAASVLRAIQIIQDAKKRRGRTGSIRRDVAARLSRVARFMSKHCAMGASGHQASVRALKAEQRNCSWARNRSFV